ncbi:MAG: DNA repair protein RecN [Chloroflexi bacterium HGW-Chloroflexi-10]|nr:MAG: DNA repair protein RecN [Chloroflexi bacterium HGW-Chloroflexi-10]
MLVELRITNFAIIDHLELEFGNGLITFTGETGAGKSIILDAIEALVGGRVDSTSIRAETERATLEAVFRLTDHNRPFLTSLLEPDELMDDPNYITLGREIRREGRTIARVNGRTVNVSLLRDLGAYLVDIHGQSEHLSLLNVRKHLALLDRFAVSSAALQDYQQVYRMYRKVRRELEDLIQKEKDAERRTELLQFQVDEIENARPVPGEEGELKEERNRLANAENLAESGRTALAFLDEGEPEMPTISELTGQLVHAISGLVKIDPARNNLAEQADQIAVLVDELARDIRAYLEEVEFNPRRLEFIEERLELLRNLERKYGGSLEQVLAYAQNASEELEKIAHATERIAVLTEEEKKLLPQIKQKAEALSTQRKQAAKVLGRGVEKELNDLSMAGARFEVGFTAQADEQGLPWGDGQRVHFDENGIDQVEFLIAPNPGEGLKPMVKIASGGETARLMLALKRVLTQADEIPTLIFDEIDQGIGGRVGFVVGEKLWQLARDHQVLCVTHLPQLAAFGDQHYRVLKTVKEERTQTRVEMMGFEERRKELAQMLGALSEAHLTTAEETLRTAQARTRAFLQKQSPRI